MKTKFRVLSAIMTVALILSSLVIVVPTSVSAAVPTDTWATHAATAFAGGDGSADHPYQIATAEQLAYLANCINGSSYATYQKAHYEVTKEIDATAYQWVSIGTTYDWSGAGIFMGTFDGGGYTIKTVLTDMTNWNESATAAGLLFGNICGATVKNVTLDATMDYSKVMSKKKENGSYAMTSVNNGCFALFAGSILGASMVTNCHVEMHVTGKTQTQWTGRFKGFSAYPLAGFFGYTNANNAVVKNCSLSGNLSIQTMDFKYDATSGEPVDPATAQAYGNQFGFAGFSAIMSNTGTITFDGCSTKAILQLQGGRHQAYLSGLYLGHWNNRGTNNVVVNNFVDANTVATKLLTSKKVNNKQYTLSAYSLHYGSIVGRPLFIDEEATSSTATIQASGVISMPDFQISDGGYAATSGVATMIGTSFYTPSTTAKTTFANIFTTNPYLPDLHMGSTATIAATDAGVDQTLGGTLNQLISLNAVSTATFKYAVKDEKTSITIPAALFNIFKGIDINAVVGYGSATTSSYVEDENGDYVFELDSTTGTGYISAKHPNGKEVALYDSWETYASAIPDMVTTTIAEPFTGSGTTADPYEIKSEEQFASLIKLYSMRYGNAAQSGSTYYNKYFELGKNMELKHRAWTAIGSYNIDNRSNDFRFKQGFNGMNFAINDMTIVDGACDDDMPAALFGAAANGTKIENFTLTGSIDVTDSDPSDTATSVGMVCGFASGPTNINNVDVDATVNVKVAANGGFSWVGGIVGTGNNVNLTNCTMKGSVTVTGTKGYSVIPNAGGIIGASQGYGTASGCINYANVTVKGVGTNSLAGGIVGTFSGNGDGNAYKIEKCINYGTISVEKDGSNTAANNQRLGGIVGSAGRSGATAPVTVTNCANFGEIKLGAGVKKGGSSGLGHIVGLNEITGTKGLIINNVFAPFDAEGTFGFANAVVVTDDKTVYLNNAAVTKDGSQLIDAESYFEIETAVAGETATVKVSKKAVDILMACGFAFELKYGDNTVTTASETTEGKAYVYNFTAVDGATATATLKNADGTVTLTATPSTWAGMYAADTFASDNAETDTIEIKTAEEFALIARAFNMRMGEVSNADFVLSGTIDLGGHEWQPIGMSHSNTAAVFSGSINGEENAIKNLTLSAESYRYNQSLIGKTSDDFKVVDLKFIDPYIKVTDISTVEAAVAAAAVLVGSNYAAKSEITNVDVTGLVIEIANEEDSDKEKEDNNVMNFIGGLVGYYAADNDAVIQNCDVAGKIYGIDVNGNDLKIGGIVGRGRMGKILNCTTDVDIDVTVQNATGSNYAGGIMGIFYPNADAENVTIDSCVVKGDISLYVNSNTSRYAVVGGVVGYVNGLGNHVIKNNTVGGELGVTTDTADKVVASVGGILGRNKNQSHKFNTATNRWEVATGEEIQTTSTTTLSGNYALSCDQLIGYDETKSAVVSKTDTAWNVGVTTDGGAQVRVDGTEFGLRFNSYIDSTLYNNIVNDQNVTIKEIGTYIAPTKLVNAAVGMEKLIELGGNYAPYQIVYNLAMYQENGLGVDGFADKDGIAGANPDGNYFSGAVVGVKNKDMVWTAVAYVTVTVNGHDFTFFADYAGESEDPTENDRARSMAYVAKCAYNDRMTAAELEEDPALKAIYVNPVNEDSYSPYSSEQLNVLYNYYN